jgi:GTP cyclohydrolase I
MKRQVMDKRRLREITLELLTILGENPQREGLKGTPERVADMYEELTSGYSEDPKVILSREFSEVTGMVVAKDIDFFSLCEHHLLPFYGRVSVGYIPAEKVVGLSKLVRLVGVYSRRLQLQERMTKQIADAINRNLKPIGVIVVVQARHLCMEMRGVKNAADIVTSEIRGQFERYETRNEFLSMLNRPNLPT